jgi:chromosome segregation ATPase
MLKNALIIALLLLVIYLYYQQKKNNFLTGTTSEVKEVDPSFSNFLQTKLNSNNLPELKTKLGEKTLDELIEENEDYETEVDTLTRTKNSLEQDLTAQAQAFQSRLKEKDREVKKLKEDLTSEKQQHKGSLARISKLTEQITNLEKKSPGEFPTANPTDLSQVHQEQLRKINLLFDDQAQDYPEIDFNGLYSLLATIAEEQKKAKK